MAAVVVSTNQFVGSGSKTITSYDWWKVWKGFWYGQGGAAVVALVAQLVSLWNTGAIDLGLGAWAIFLAPFISSAINAFLRWLQDTRVIEVPKIES